AARTVRPVYSTSSTRMIRRPVTSKGSRVGGAPLPPAAGGTRAAWKRRSADAAALDRKSTRLNSSHLVISYAVFCLKKKKIYPPFGRRPSHRHLTIQKLDVHASRDRQHAENRRHGSQLYWPGALAASFDDRIVSRHT